MNRTTALITAAAVSVIAIVAGIFVLGGDDADTTTSTEAPAEQTVDEVAEEAIESADASTEPADDTVADQPAETDEAAAEAEPWVPTEQEIADLFVNSFSEAHENGDTDFLLGTLHPDIPVAFGAETCTNYVESTAGSIADMTITSVGDRETYTLPSPNGEISFDDSIPVEALWTIVHSSEQQAMTFHLAPIAGGDRYGWLTQCGVEVEDTQAATDAEDDEPADVEDEVDPEDDVSDAESQAIADCYMYLEMYPELLEEFPNLITMCESDVNAARNIISKEVYG